MKWTRTLCFVLILMHFAPTAQAYVWDTCRNIKQTWDSNAVTFRPSSISFPSGSSFRASVEAARLAWNNALGTNFDIHYDYRHSSSYSSGDDVNSILITHNYGWDGNVRGVAIRKNKWCSWPFWAGKIKEVDVLYRSGENWNNETNPAPPVLALNSTIVGLHELGHAFGLDHEDHVQATMNANFPNGGPIGENNDVEPHADDILGNRDGYGTVGSVRDVYATTYSWFSPGHSYPISVPGTIYRNSPTHFQFTFGNRGTVNESLVEVQFYFSTDRNISASDYFVGSAGFLLNQGVTQTRTVAITAPSAAPAGDYYFGWIVDPNNNIPEAREDNNSMALVGQTTLVNLSPPNACFTTSTVSGGAPLTVTFNASCSSDSDGTLIAYTWDMGDGNTRSGTSFSHTYWSAGSYMVTLTVRDDDSLTDTSLEFIDVWSDCSGDEICFESGELEAER